MRTEEDDGAGAGAGEDHQVEEEFSVWKKNSPFLYDLIVSHSLEWPSLTVQWLPSPPSPYKDGSFATHKLILGTHTSDESPNFLLVADVLLPVNPSSSLDTNHENPHIPKVSRSLVLMPYFYPNRYNNICSTLKFLFLNCVDK